MMITRLGGDRGQNGKTCADGQKSEELFHDDVVVCFFHRIHAAVSSDVRFMLLFMLLPFF